MLMNTRRVRARIQSQVPSYRYYLRIVRLDMEFKAMRLDEISHEVNLDSRCLEVQKMRR